MPQALCPEMAHGLLQPLLDRLGERPADRSEAEVDELFSACELVAAMVDRFSGLFQRLLAAGIEKQRLTLTLKEFAAVIDSARNQIYPRVARILSQVIPQGPAQIKATEAVEGFARKAETISGELSSLDHWLSRAQPKPIDPSRFVNSSSSEYRDIQEVLARLKSGVEA